MPALVVSKRTRGFIFYDLTTPPPVLRTEEPSAAKLTDVSTWKHSSVISSYNDAELEFILEYLRTGRSRARRSHARSGLHSRYDGSSGRYSRSSRFRGVLRPRDAERGGRNQSEGDSQAVRRDATRVGSEVLRVLVPLGFATPIEAVVSHRADFVCRTEFASHVKQKRQGELYIFTYGINNGARSGAVLHLRSEEATVVIDGASAKQ